MSGDDAVPEQVGGGAGDGARGAEENSDSDTTIPLNPPRGVEANFDASKVVPDDSCKTELLKLAKERQDLATAKKALSKQLKNARKVRDRLKKKSQGLSQNDLCQIIAMKQDLANQWKSKQSGSSSSAASAGNRAA